MNYRLPRTSVDSLAKAAEERLIREKMADGARSCL